MTGETPRPVDVAIEDQQRARIRDSVSHAVSEGMALAALWDCLRKSGIPTSTCSAAVLRYQAYRFGGDIDDVEDIDEEDDE